MRAQGKRYGIKRLVETIQVSENISRSMRNTPQKGTGPELKLRSALWKAGLRGYRVNVRNVVGKPDIFFRRARLAVFVHGCFWHGCPHCKRNLKPKTNSHYWETKIDQTRVRDAAVRSELEALNYRVLVFWECELTAARIDDAVALIGNELDRV
jgi:DNA mismatch endonuclease, patch repair protein